MYSLKFCTGEQGLSSQADFNLNKRILIQQPFLHWVCIVLIFLWYYVYLVRNTLFTQRCQYTATTKILRGFVFFCKWLLLLFKPHCDYNIEYGFSSKKKIKNKTNHCTKNHALTSRFCAGWSTCAIVHNPNYPTGSPWCAWNIYTPCHPLDS